MFSGSDDDDYDCPLCMEELDISDRNFRPCPCGYQICRFCWHHIKEDLNGRCPACRRIYSEETVEFTPISADELAMIKNEKKAKEKEKKEIEAMNRKHLSNMRVVQKSLVYVIGLPTKLANDEHTLRQHEYFGQYGKISKVVINRRNTPMPIPGSAPAQPSLGVYITYVRKEDAAKAIAAIDGSIWDGKILRASYGTTKYCTYYLRGMNCQNPGCMYLHEPGEDADSYTKEDLAVGKHHLQEHMAPYDPYSQKPAVLGRPPLPSQSSSSSLTPRPKLATVASYHSATGSLADWPAPGERSGGDDRDRDDDSSALPATASWAKLGSNPSTPTLASSTPLLRRTEPPPLRSKGSTASIITGVVVNKKKETPALDYAPTPAEALAIEAAVKQQLLQEQRQLLEQQRKQQLLLQKQLQEESDQNEVLNQKLRKQRQLEQEQEQQEQQRHKQQQEMDTKLQKQKEKEQQRKENQRKEKEQEQAERARKETEEMEKQQKKEIEEKEAQVRKRREKEEQEARLAQSQAESLFATGPALSLGSFSFNPDASLSTLPYSYGGTNAEVPGSFGLDTFSAYSNLPVTPGHYTGSFNPFSLDDEPLLRRPAAPSSRSYLGDSDYEPSLLRDRPVGPPIPGKPRQTSRFGFAMENQYGDTFGADGYTDPSMQSMQDGFRALFPNINVSFGANGVMNLQQQQLQQQQQQQQQQNQSQQYPAPLMHRQEAPNAGMWERSMGQLNMDPLLTAPSTRMAEYHQQLLMQQHTQRSAPPGITRGAINPSAVKSPPPGLETVVRTDLGGSWSGSQSQQQQQQQQPSSRMNGWSNEGSTHTVNGHIQDNAQDFFGAFLKAAAATPTTQSTSGAPGPQGGVSFQDPAIMTVRMSSAGATKASLVEALQNPPGMGYRIMGQGDYSSSGPGPFSNDSMADANNDKDNSNDGSMKLQRQGTPESPSLQQFPLGSKRKEIKSVKGVLNSGMNAPLNSAGSKSRQSSRPGSPSLEQRTLLQQQHQQQLQQQLQLQQQQQQQQRPSAFGSGESLLMNGSMSAAARAAKVKSDLLMGLNSLSARPGTPKDSSTGALSVGSDGGSPNQMNQMKLNMLNQGSYGSTPYESVRMNGYGSSGTVSGPPPGLGPSNGTISGNGSNNNSPHMMSTMLNRENGHQGLPSYGNSGKPLDVATMMSTLDLFGPGSPASSLMMSPNWSSMTNGSSQQQQQQQQQHQQQQQQQQQQRQEMMNGQGGRSTNEEVNGGSATGSSTPTQTSLSTAHSVEDLELQVINAKMETQMLENQLNAVIKRNRRKLYA